MASSPTQQGDRHDRLKALVSKGNVYGGTDEISRREGADWWLTDSEKEAATKGEPDPEDPEDD